MAWSQTTLITVVITASIVTRNCCTHAQSNPTKRLGGFKTFAHGVRSDPVVILDDNTVFIPKFYYDGRGPDAYFWIGRGPHPSENGVKIPYGGNDDKLGEFNGVNVTLTLPNNLTVNDIDWLSVWCVTFRHNFGHVTVHNISEEVTPPKKLGRFSTLAHNVSSGDILALDDEYILIHNFYYDGNGPDAYFWAGKGDTPSENGVKLVHNDPDKKLGKFAGQNVIVRLPEGVRIDDIDWISVWCIKFKHDFGHVILRNLLTEESSTMGSRRFSTLAHNVTSGDVSVIDDETIFIPDFHYDGKGPDAYFWVGRGDEPSENGVKVAYGDPNRKLGKYNGQNVTLRLPESVSVKDIDWISVWCITYKHDFGHVMLRNVRKKQYIRSIIRPTMRVLPEFSRLAHDLRSGNITIIDDKTILIPDLYYDGLGPDAHFWVGNGSAPSEAGVKVPFKGYTETLPSFNGTDVILVLPKGVNVNNIEWLGVWCIKYKHNFGYVRLHDKTVLRRALKLLPEFSRLAHGLRSGNITVIDEKTILIPDLYYDGLGPDAHFWIGNGTELSENGVPVPYQNFDDTLPAFNGENVTLTLPRGITVDDIDWLGVWCIKFKHNFGFVRLHPEIKKDYIRLPKFKELAHGLRSGPILLIDERTFFIPNLHYDGKGPDAYFWVGKGTKGPDENGFKIPNERNSTLKLDKYTGEDVYVQLPSNITVRDIDYIGMWCVKYKHNFGYTDIPKNLDGVPQALGNHEFDKDGNYIARLPKCCPAGEIKTEHGCKRRTREIIPMEVYEGNTTIFDDEPMEKVEYSYYDYKPKCEFGMFYVDKEETYYLLDSGILLMSGSILTKDSFCVDVVAEENEEGNVDYYYTPFVCFPERNSPEVLNKIFAGCIYVSAVFLIITSGIFIFNKEARDARGFNVVGYSVFMALSFTFLATARLLHVDGQSCTVVGFIYQFFLVSSFAWLCCLSFETFHRVSNPHIETKPKQFEFNDGSTIVRYNREHSKRRFYKYGAFAIGVPIAAVVLSLLVHDKIPNNFGDPSVKDSCWFRSDKRIIFYYIPIALSVAINVVLNFWTWRKIKTADRLNVEFYDSNAGEDAAARSACWISVAGDLKNVFRSCYLLLIVMTLCWSAEIMSYFLDSKSGFSIAIDVIDSLQGLFVFIIFVLHNPVIGILKKKFNSNYCDSFSMQNRETELLYSVQSARPPTTHLEVLTTIKHAESVENLNNN